MFWNQADGISGVSQWREYKGNFKLELRGEKSMRYWQLIFTQSKANGGIYKKDKLPEHL